MRVTISRSFIFSDEEIEKARHDWGIGSEATKESIAQQLAINAMDEEDKRDVPSLYFHYASN